jgi:hypothetical protein
MIGASGNDDKGSNSGSAYISEQCTSTVDITTSLSGVTITANATGASYKWLDCNDAYSVIPNEIDASFTATTSGNYSVEISENNCVDTSLCVMVSVVGISNNTIFNEVSIYPNPNEGMVNVELGDLRNVSIKVLDITGQEVYSQENISTSTHQFEIDEVAGIYIIEVTSQGEKQQYKLIKK